MLLAPLACAGGCYPIYHTLRPEATLTVLDPARRPVAGARVLLTRSRFPAGFDQATDTTFTDSTGVAHFSRQKGWETEVLMIHGAKIYFWNWCVQKPGMTTFDTRHNATVGFSATMSVTLAPGESAACFTRR